jgi:hypothetical protein
MLKGPRIKAGFITPSCDLFLMCGGERNIQDYTMYSN